MQTLIKSDEIDIYKLIDIRKEATVKTIKMMPIKSNPIILNQTPKKVKISEEAYRRERIKAEYIIDLVCEFYNIPKHKLTQSGKVHDVLIVKIKHQSMYFIYEFTELGEPAIGPIFNRDHSSVNCAKKSVIKDMSYPKYQEEFEKLRKIIERSVKKLNININSFNFLLRLLNKINSKFYN